MSFGINGPDNLPSISPSHRPTDGGAGNLGYFKRKDKDEDEEQENDIFESSKDDDGDEILMNELDSIGTKIKNFWHNMNIIKKLKEKNPEDI